MRNPTQTGLLPLTHFSRIHTLEFTLWKYRQIVQTPCSFVQFWRNMGLGIQGRFICLFNRVLPRIVISKKPW